MKAARTLTAVAASAALLCALPTPSEAIEKVDTRNLNTAEDDVSRELMHVSISFKEECHLKQKDECIAAIDAKLAAYPELFDNRSSFYYEVNKIRERSDAGYNLVSLRLNEDEATVGGLLGDGMIWYPYQWCLAADDCNTVGPWDCDVGIPLSKEECCNMIKDSVPKADLNGNYLECHYEYPIGSATNPVNPGRVCIHTDAAGIVVNIPKNE